MSSKPVAAVFRRQTSDDSGIRTQLCSMECVFANLVEPGEKLIVVRTESSAAV